MFRVSVGDYQLCCQTDGLPELLIEYQQRAKLSESFGQVEQPGSSSCFIKVGRTNEWPSLVVTQHYAPAGYGFVPGVLLVPETHRLFIGAGTRLLAYDLSAPARVWVDEAECGFWFWLRHGSFVLMGAELELAVWDIHGRKLWTRFVEPPWEYIVSGDTVRLDVMGEVSHLDLRTGEQV